MNPAVWIWQAGAVLALGGSLFLLRAGPPPESLTRWTVQVRRALAVAAALAWLAGYWVLVHEATRIVGHPLALDAPEWRVLLTRTRFGQVWGVKQGLLAALVLVAALSPRAAWARIATPCLAAGFLAAGVWAGHGGATLPLAFNLPLHAAHVLAAGLWLGGLPCWASLVRTVRDEAAERAYLARAITRFSAAASLMMAVLIATGIVISTRQFERWPALFGTSAGALLGAKIACLALALACAWRLRQRFLARLGEPHLPALRAAAFHTVLVEGLAALGVFVLALELARSTPAAHLPVTWPWPFRIAPDAAWADPRARWYAVIGVAIALCAIPARAARHPRLAIGVFAGGLALLTTALAIPAYPETYRRPDVPYTAGAVATGAALFTQHCTGCHGAGARGDGRAPAVGTALAADLSEHTALHTAGDMFWWLTHGTPTGNMPGFGAVLDDPARWSIINFLRAFADGHRARVLAPAPVPLQPWLGAPNFAFETIAGENGELKDFREQQPVLLIVASLPASAARLAALAGSADLQAGHVKLLTVLLAGECTALAQADTLGCITLGAADIGFTYRLLARTLGNPGSRHALAPDVAHVEYLVDRYGYLRARFIPAQEPAALATPALLARAAQALAAEPRVRDAPDEHVH